MRAAILDPFNSSRHYLISKLLEKKKLLLITENILAPFSNFLPYYYAKMATDNLLTAKSVGCFP